MQMSLFSSLISDPRSCSAIITDNHDPEKWRYAISLDTETSGSCAESRVIQLAAIRFRYRLLVNMSVPEVEFSERFRLVTFVRPPLGTVFNPYATRVHGITPEQLRHAPDYKAVHEQFLEVVGDLDIIAHNATFDRRMVEREHHLSGLQILPASRWVCSLALSKERHPQESCKLGEITRRLGILPSGALHDAGVDAELAARLYAHLIMAPVSARS